MKSFTKNLKIMFVVFVFIFIFNFNNVSAQIANKFLPITYDVGCIDATYDLSLGSRDYALFGNVLLLQTFLFQNHIMDYAPTAYFGPITESALKKYQISRNLYPTGVFDTNTRKAVARDTCELNEIRNNTGNIPYYPNQNSGTTPQYPNTQPPTANYPTNQYPTTTYPTQGRYLNLTEQMIFPQQ